jgi:hypothetical protein
VVVKVREILIVNKQTMHRFHAEGFNLNKLNKAEGKGQHWGKISNWLAALEN